MGRLMERLRGLNTSIQEQRRKRLDENVERAEAQAEKDKVEMGKRQRLAKAKKTSADLRRDKYKGIIKVGDSIAKGLSKAAAPQRRGRGRRSERRSSGLELDLFGGSPRTQRKTKRSKKRKSVKINGTEYQAVSKKKKRKAQRKKREDPFELW